MSTVGIANTWTKILRRMAVRGMLSDTAFTGPGVSGIDAAREVLDAVHSQMTRHAAARRRRFVDGLRDRATALIWLGQSYLFTKAASYHISPVLGNDMAPQERALWTRLLKDESWHWRIYRPAMALYGMGFADFDDLRPVPSTQRTLDILHDGAARSPVVYSALTVYLEKPPAVGGPESHSVMSTLMRDCGFTRASVRPLWWHAMENEYAGHSDLGAVVIANRRRIERAELDDAIATADELIGASCDWLTDVI
jgi:hypothetical protein